MAPVIQYPHYSRRLSGGLPLVHGDYFRPADRIISNFYNLGVLGNALGQTLALPAVISGMQVSAVGNEVTVTAGEAILSVRQLANIQNHDAAATPLVDPLSLPASWQIHKLPNSQTIASTTAGNYFLKARYVPVVAQTRTKAAAPAAPAYGYADTDSLEVFETTALPVAGELILATYTRAVTTGIISALSTSVSSGSRSRQGATLLNNSRISVPVATSSSVAPLKVLRVSGRSVNGVPIVSPLTSLSQVPVGLNELEINSAEGEMIKYGPVLTGIDTSATPIGNSVYADISGNLTLSETPLPIGYTMNQSATASWIFFDFGGSGGGGGGSGTAISIPVAQTGHGLIPGNPIYFDGSNWEPARSDSNATVGIATVSAVSDANNFRYVPYGIIDLSTSQWDAVTGLTGGLVPGDTYRTSSAIAGRLTSDSESIDNPIIIALSATVALVQPGFVAAESGAGNTKVEVVGTTSGSAGQSINVGFSLEGQAYVDVFIGGSIQPTANYTISGTSVVITSAQIPGLPIIVKATIATTFSNDISQFLGRKSIALLDDAQVILNSTALFPTVANGIYELFDSSDPTTAYGTIRMKQGTPPTISGGGGSDFDLADTDTKLCVFVSGNDVVIKNRLGSSKTIIVHRKI
jgi:hypothetical protein